MSRAGALAVAASEEGDGFRIRVRSDGGVEGDYFVPTGTQQDFSLFFRELAETFGTRVPDIFGHGEHPASTMRWQPLLTENVHPQILVGYGDPAVMRDGEDYWLVATSNDAPDAFPILHSRDLEHWEPRGFVFPEGQQPQWAAKG